MNEECRVKNSRYVGYNSFHRFKWYSRCKDSVFLGVKGACLSEERRVKSEKFDTLVDYCYFTFHLTACATDMNQQS